MSRVFTGLLLTLVLAVLVVPLGFYAGPPVLAALRHEQPQRQVVVPSYQQAPDRLAAGGEEFPVPAGTGNPAPAPDRGTLAELLDAELTVTGSGDFTGAVLDALTGEVLYDLDGGAAVTPASSLKVLTAAAALSELGADTRFETAVYAGSAPGTIVLKGGGDVLLTAGESDDEDSGGRAGLQTLAEETAAALAQRGTRGTVRIELDDTLFTGSSLSPAWSREDVAAGEMAPLYPLAINSAWAPPDRGLPTPDWPQRKRSPAPWKPRRGTTGSPWTPGLSAARPPTAPTGWQRWPRLRSPTRCSTCC